jgi:predicted amino acid-binding ACT domain protein
VRAASMGTLRVEGTDRPGLGSKITRAIADAGVNVRGVSAAVIGNKFVAYIGLDSDADATTAAKALKSVNAGGAAKKPASKRRR